MAKLDGVARTVDSTALDALLTGMVTESGLVGCSVGLVRPGQETYTWSSGVGDLRTGGPFTENSSFRIASTGKVFTGIGIMQLRDRGLVDLHAPVSTYLRSYAWHTAPGSRAATLRDLMTHTAGIGEFLGWKDLFKPLAGLGVKSGARPHRLADNYPAGITPSAAPGERWAYANHAVATLGQVIEDVSGIPFAEYMKQHVFDPLAMSHTDFDHSERVGTPVTGYRKSRGRDRQVPYYECAVPPAGSAFSSVADMSRFMTALLGTVHGHASTVLAPKTLAEMFECHWAPDPRLQTQGLVFMIDEVAGHRVIWHDGGYPGYVTSMMLIPDCNVGVIVFNNSFGDSHGIAEAVLRTYLEAPPLVDEVSRRSPVSNSQVWNDLVGRYSPPRGIRLNLRTLALYGNQLSISIRDGQLTARGGPPGTLNKPITLHQSDPNDPYVYEAIAPIKKTSRPTRLRLAFTPGIDGRPMALAGHNLLPFVFTRTSPWRSPRRILLIAALACTLAAVLLLV